MELYFACPVSGEVFASENYVLGKDYEIVENGEEGKELVGMVVLQGPCPLCGGKHHFEVKDVICPLTGEVNGNK